MPTFEAEKLTLPSRIVIEMVRAETADTHPIWVVRLDDQEFSTGGPLSLICQRLGEMMRSLTNLGVAHEEPEP